MRKNEKEIIKITNAKRVYGNQWKGHCPCHDDQTPSLSIRFESEKLNPLIFCHAGCSQEDIITYFVNENIWEKRSED